MSPARALSRGLTLVSSLCLLLLGSQAPASAHAMLETTLPVAGSTVDAAPSTIVLHFGEAVGVPPEGLRVLDARGRSALTGPASASGHYVRGRLSDQLAEGSYLVVWRVVSADSHPVEGSFSFSVGHAGPLAALRAVGPDRWLSGSVAAARAVGYLGLAAFAGGVWFGLLCLPWLVWSSRGRRLVLVGWVATLAGGAASLLLQGPYGRGLGLGHALDPDLLRADLDGRYGHAVLVRLALVVVAGVLTRRLRLGVSSATGTLFTVSMLGAFGTFAWTGHAGVGSLVPVSVLSDVVHLTAMSLWLGGLLQLAVAVVPVAENRVARRAAVRFSRVAALSVAALVVTGTFQAWRQVAATGELWTTSYGQLLLVKVGVVVSALAVASRSRRWVLRHGGRVVVAAHLDVAVADIEEATADLRLLRTSVAVEAVALVVVLAITSVLVSTPPARGGHPTDMTRTAAVASALAVVR